MGGARQGKRETKDGQRKTNMLEKRRKEGRLCANASASSWMAL